MPRDNDLQLIRGLIAQTQLRAGVARTAADGARVVADSALDLAGDALPAIDYTAVDVLAKLLTVDGPSSGLDADTLDGHDSGYFLPAAISRVAGEALSGHRAVYVANDDKAYYAASTSHARQCIGITTGAATLGGSVTIQLDGEIEEPSWAWIDSEVVWLSTSGLLTQTVPTANVAFQVGVPLGPTKMRIEPQLIAQIS